MLNRIQIFLLLMAAALCCGGLVGCKKECKTGTTECINGELIRTCVPTADSNEWLISQCPSNSSCVDDGASADAGAGSAAVAACVGTCDVGESECVDDSLARFCVNGGIWELDMCGVGEKCVSGKCTIGEGDGSVQACVPGTKQCASDLVEKVCDPDGTAWIQQPCMANEVCVDTECTADPASSCDDGNQCLDNTHAIRCLGKDQGFSIEECQNGTYCLGGVCRGSVCAIGSTCAGPNQVRECVDGESFVDTQCAANEVCEQRPDSDTAACVPIECKLNTTVCGDPRDPSVDTTQFFTTCTTSNVTGNPAWATGECTGLTTCDPTVLGGGTTVQSPCRQDCTPGAQRCVGVGGTSTGTGVVSGIQTCGDDGTWMPAENCNEGTNTYLQCALTMSSDPGELPTAICAEPVCAAVFNYNNANMDPLTDLEGACTDSGELRRCKPDGTLAAATACDNYVCEPGTGMTSDGYTPGLCPKTPVCDDGDERCVWDSTTPTPYYQTCVNGFWSNELKTCANDGLCYPAKTDGTGKLCGAECTPGSHRCDPTDADGKSIQTCNNKGKLGAAEQCDKGMCGFSSTYNDAVCMLDCVPRDQVCLGTTVLSADYTHYGTNMTATCGSDGLLNTATSCDPGTTCRKSSTGIVLGCVECVGTDVPGGNESGINDTVCDDVDNGRILECGADNTFSARDCNGSKVCQGGGMLTCGSCYSAFGYYLAQCSEALVNDTETCGSCNVPQNAGGTVLAAQCTEASILATGDAVSTTCVGNSFGSAVNITGSVYGNVTGCCSNYVLGTASCGTEGLGTASLIDGVTDCCSAAEVATGSGIAYCVAP